VCIGFCHTPGNGPRVKMPRSSSLGLLLGATLLVACGAEPERYGSAGGASEPRKPQLAAGQPTSSTAGQTGLGSHEGVLSLTARSALRRQLDVISYTVRDAYGDVVAGGEAEAAQGGAQDHALSLVLPAGKGLDLELTTTTRGAETSTCTAAVGPIDIEAGSQASYQVFVWRCDGSPGAEGPEPECYWLADWFGVTRTRAAIGERIGLRAAGHDAAGAPAQFQWSAPSPAMGRFDDEHAAETSFRCAAENVALPLGLSLSDGRCKKDLSELVACQ
jgi:hypothetical protein